MEHRRIIKRGPVVLATNENGTMDPTSTASQGLFLGDTRFLSKFQICLNGHELTLMASSEEILFESSFIFTNQALDGIPARGLGLLQHNTIGEDAVKLSVTVINWSLQPVEFELSIEVGSDFFDSFEARGVKRLKRGELKEPIATKDTLELNVRWARCRDEEYPAQGDAGDVTL